MTAVGDPTKKFRNEASRRIVSARQRFGWLDLIFRVYRRLEQRRFSRVAAGITYYSFVSLFPLLMVATTILAFVVTDQQRADLAAGALQQVPVLGKELADTSKPLQGSVVVLVLGIVTALFSGTSCMVAIQDALNDIWDVPRTANPNFLLKRGRALLGVVVTGLGLGAFSAILGVVQVFGDNIVLSAIGLVVLVAINSVVGALVLQVLIHGQQPWRQLRPAAVCFSIGYGLVSQFGGVYLQRVVTGAGSAYGTFATVLGLLAFLYLVAIILLTSTAVAAEMNPLRPSAEPALSPQQS
jgi:membrane protein